MLLDPAQWLADFMNLTPMSLDFQLLLLVLAAIGFVVAYAGERVAFPRLAKALGVWKQRALVAWRKRKGEKGSGGGGGGAKGEDGKVVDSNGKKRKEYKVLREEIWGEGIKRD